MWLKNFQRIFAFFFILIVFHLSPICMSLPNPMHHHQNTKLRSFVHSSFSFFYSIPINDNWSLKPELDNGKSHFCYSVETFNLLTVQFLVHIDIWLKFYFDFFLHSNAFKERERMSTTADTMLFQSAIIHWWINIQWNNHKMFDKNIFISKQADILHQYFSSNNQLN